MPIPFDEHVVGRITTAAGELVAVVVRLPGADEQVIPAAAYARLASGESDLGYHQAVARAIAEAGPGFQDAIDAALAAATAPAEPPAPEASAPVEPPELGAPAEPAEPPAPPEPEAPPEAASRRTRHNTKTKEKASGD